NPDVAGTLQAAVDKINGLAVRPEVLQDLLDGVEFFRLRKVADVAGVQKKFRSDGEAIDLVHSGLQSPRDVRIGRFIKAHVAVADLGEAQFASYFLGHLPRVQLRQAAHAVGAQHAAADHAKSAGAGPGHALQEAAPVDAVMIVVVQQLIL